MSQSVHCLLEVPTAWRERPRFKVLQPVSRGGYGVRAGRWTDFASVPRRFHAWFPPIDRYALSALVHDCALADGLGWKTANRIFAAGLREDGVTPVRRFFIMGAVRLNAVRHRLTGGKDS